MGYLDPTEYIAYGLTAETPDDWVGLASALIEAHCRRPSLLVTQYVERMRLTAGSQAVRLSYLPLAPLGSAASQLVGIHPWQLERALAHQCRPQFRNRRGYIPHEPARP